MYYESEAKWKQIILFAAILTIFISCIGCLGISINQLRREQKKLNRKVVG